MTETNVHNNDITPNNVTRYNKTSSGNGAPLGNANRDTVYRKRMAWLARASARSEKLRKVLLDPNEGGLPLGKGDDGQSVAVRDVIRAVEAVSDRAGPAYAKTTHEETSGIVRVIVERYDAPAITSGTRSVTARAQVSVSNEGE